MLQITKNQNGGEVEAKCGESFAINLPENPTTGYRWHLRQSGNSIVELQNDSFQLSGETALGAGGVRSWHFRAVQEGVTTLELEHRRSWEKQSLEAWRVTIRVVR